MPSRSAHETLDLAGQGRCADAIEHEGRRGRRPGAIAAAVAADPKLADQAARYADRAKLVSRSLDPAAGRDDQSAGLQQKLMAAVALMADVKLNAEVFRNMQQVAQILK
jgi:hypothetical protein